MIVETNKNTSTGKYEVDIKTNGVVAELEANKEVSIDVSNYSEPVEITPSSGKDGMEKVTVTLENISSGSTDLENNHEIEITENGTVEITPAMGKNGMKKVTATVNVVSSSQHLQKVCMLFAVSDGAFASAIMPVLNTETHVRDYQANKNVFTFVNGTYDIRDVFLVDEYNNADLTAYIGGAQKPLRASGTTHSPCDFGTPIEKLYAYINSTTGAAVLFPEIPTSKYSGKAIVVNVTQSGLKECLFGDVTAISVSNSTIESLNLSILVGNGSTWSSGSNFNVVRDSTKDMTMPTENATLLSGAKVEEATTTVIEPASGSEALLGVAVDITASGSWQTVTGDVEYTNHMVRVQFTDDSYAYGCLGDTYEDDGQIYTLFFAMGLDYNGPIEASDRSNYSYFTATEIMDWLTQTYNTKFSTSKVADHLEVYI